MTFTTIVAYMIRLTTSLDVGVHARSGRHVTAMEIRMRYLVQNWIVNAGCSRDFTEILTFRLASSWFWLHVILLQGLLFVVLGAVVLYVFLE